MKLDKKALRLYAVTNRTQDSSISLMQQVSEALSGGITCLQLREKHLDDTAFSQEAEQIKKLCNKYNVPLIINDNINIALKSGADGVHVGQTDMNAKEARRIIGKDKILGVTVRTPEQAIQAEADGADYLGAGAVFTTATKTDTQKLPYETLKKITESVSIPVVAIGGINESNISQLAGSGISGVAVVSAIFSSKNIKKTCETLYRLSGEMAGYED